MIYLLYLFSRRGIERLQHARRLAAERQAFDQLPPYLLRDLGVDRSEYDSYLAESRRTSLGRAKATRRRLGSFGA